MSDNAFSSGPRDFTGPRDFNSRVDDFTPNAGEGAKSRAQAKSIQQGGSGVCCLSCLGCGGLLLVLVIIAGVVGYLTAFQGKPLEISEETTVLTEPLKSDGKVVDYFAVLQEKQRELAPPKEENAFVLFCERFGPDVLENPRKSAPPWMWDALCKELDVEPNAEDRLSCGDLRADLIPEPRVFMPELTLVGDTNRNFFEELQKFSQYEAKTHWLFASDWTEEETAKMKDWFDANAKALDTAVEALGRKSFSVPRVRENENTPLGDTVPDLSVFFQNIADGLYCRSLYRLHTADADGAWEDLRSLLRLDRRFSGYNTFVTRSPLSIERLFSSGKCSEELLKKILADLEDEDRFPRFQKHREAWLTWSRYFILDGIASADKDKTAFVQRYLGNALPAQGQAVLVVFGYDWNLVAKTFNETADLYEVLGGPKVAEGQRAVEEELFKVLEDKVAAKTDNEEEFLQVLGDRGRRSRWLGEVLAHQYSLAVTGTLIRQLSQWEELVGFHAQAALELYKKRNGRYPETLETLVPDILPAVPTSVVDFGKTVRYKCRNEGTAYTLHFHHRNSPLFNWGDFDEDVFDEDIEATEGEPGKEGTDEVSDPRFHIMTRSMPFEDPMLRTGPETEDEITEEDAAKDGANGDIGEDAGVDGDTI